MKIKQLYIWQMRFIKDSICVFYGIMILVFATMVTITSIAIKNSQSQGIDEINITSTVVYIAIMGLTIFVSSFKFAIAVGVSRKTIMLTQMLTLISISGLATLFDGILAFASQATLKAMSIPIVVKSGIISGEIASFTDGAETILICFSFYLLIATVGFFIAALNNVMSKVVKLFVYIGVPTIIVAAVSLFATVASHELVEKVLTLAANIIEFITRNTLNTVFVCLCGTAVFAAVSFLCIRRAPLKTA